MISIRGIVSSVNFYNSDNGYTIAKLKPRELSSNITIVGIMGELYEGEQLDISGKWEEHEKFGEQFRVQFYQSVLPDTKEDIKKYLSSGIIKGIGPSTASKIVDFFGDETISVIETSPQSLGDVPGIGKKTAKAIEKSWANHHIARKLMQYLYEAKIPAEYSPKIIKEYGASSVEIVTKDPYKIIIDNPFFNFETIDRLGKKAGIPEDNNSRINAAIIYALEKASKNGHCFLPLENLLFSVKRLIKAEKEKINESINILEKDFLVSKEETDGEIIVYPYHLYKAEKGVADKIKAIFEIPSEKIQLKEKDIKEITAKFLGLIPSEEQLEAIKSIIKEKAGIITGGPGTGKTTIIKALYKIFTLEGKSVSLGTPTGRAARRLSEVTGAKAETIHKLLKYNQKTGFFDKNESSPLEADAVIIDEASMLDIVLCYHLLKAVTIHTKIIFVGDIFQLPSVGPGNFLSDIIQSGKIPAFSLTNIFRQAKKSPIIMNAYRVNNGELPEKNNKTKELSEFYFIQNENPLKAVDTIIKLCKNRIPERFHFDPIEDIQVITPMHKGETGTINLNKMLQKELNLQSVEIKSGNNIFKPGDKVMHLVNNYQKDVFNGDIGKIKEIDFKNEILSVIYPDYLDKTIVEYSFDELDELTLAYAISVHKSQGSEYPAVIIALMPQHYPLLQRNLLYTAMTRGKSLLIIVGSARAIQIAVSETRASSRFSGLKKRLAPQTG